jgi:N-acetylglutamate synthase-like GNAT family acetyltransferase
MTLRKKQEGKLVIEQTRDPAIVRAMLSTAGMLTEGLEWAPACYLVAYFGTEAVGVVGVEPSLDAALVRSLYVTDAMRGRGIGAELVTAARKAAHTRGARSLYLFGNGAGEFFQRLGFIETPVAALETALGAVPLVRYFQARRSELAELAREVAWYLDISQDGVILR